MSTKKTGSDLTSRIANATTQVKDTAKANGSAKKASAPAKATAAKKDVKEVKKPAEGKKAEKTEAKKGLDSVMANLSAIGRLSATMKKSLRKSFEDEASAHHAAELIAGLVLRVTTSREGKRAILSVPKPLADLISEKFEDKLEGISAGFTSNEVLQLIAKSLQKHTDMETEQNAAKIPVTFFNLAEEWRTALKTGVEAFDEKRKKKGTPANLDHLSNRDFTSIMVLSCFVPESVEDEDEVHKSVDKDFATLTAK